MYEEDDDAAAAVPVDITDFEPFSDPGSDPASAALDPTAATTDDPASAEPESTHRLTAEQRLACQMQHIRKHPSDFLLLLTTMIANGLVSIGHAFSPFPDTDSLLLDESIFVASKIIATYIRACFFLYVAVNYWFLFFFSHVPDSPVHSSLHADSNAFFNRWWKAEPDDPSFIKQSIYFLFLFTTGCLNGLLENGKAAATAFHDWKQKQEPRMASGIYLCTLLLFLLGLFAMYPLLSMSSLVAFQRFDIHAFHSLQWIGIIGIGLAIFVDYYRVYLSPFPSTMDWFTSPSESFQKWIQTITTSSTQHYLRLLLTAGLAALIWIPLDCSVLVLILSVLGLAGIPLYSTQSTSKTFSSMFRYQNAEFKYLLVALFIGLAIFQLETGVEDIHHPTVTIVVIFLNLIVIVCSLLFLNVGGSS